jgi:hypothetical protein
MALSNWDTMALTHEGEFSRGEFVSPAGVKVEIYKNWVYVHDPKAWRQHGCFCEPVVMELKEGVAHYMDVKILALRGPQRGAYVVAWSGYKFNSTLTGMLGCGVYGYKGDDWIGVLPESLQWFQDRLREVKVETYCQEYEDENGEIVVENYEFKTPILDVPKPFREINLTEGKRFNQGDAYFERKVGLINSPTKAGESPGTILQVLDGRASCEWEGCDGSGDSGQD